jgi:hypothetical protein
MEQTMSQEVKIIDYHRNGISGLGFHVAIVHEVEDGQHREMLVIRFPKEADAQTGNVICAAFDLAKLDQREVRFFYNSFRGDHYHTIIDETLAITEGLPFDPNEHSRKHNAPTPGFKRDKAFTK